MRVSTANFREIVEGEITFQIRRKWQEGGREELSSTTRRTLGGFQLVREYEGRGIYTGTDNCLFFSIFNPTIKTPLRHTVSPNHHLLLDSIRPSFPAIHGKRDAQQSPCQLSTIACYYSTFSLGENITNCCLGPIEFS